MSSIYRIVALLALTFVFVQSTKAQSHSLNAEAQSSFFQAQEVTAVASEPAQLIPVMDVFQNPGSRSIHVHMNRLTGGTTLNLQLLAPNSRLTRNQNIHLCTMCGTFDIDLEDEVNVGRYMVIVEVDGMLFSRTIWVE